MNFNFFKKTEEVSTNKNTNEEQNENIISLNEMLEKVDNQTYYYELIKNPMSKFGKDIDKVLHRKRENVSDNFPR